MAKPNSARFQSALLSAAVAGILAGASSPAALAADPAATPDVKCYGSNSCKGKSACATSRNACAGMNSCKGQGYLMMSKVDCVKKKGKLTEPKAKSDKPQKT